eukprot:3612646-Pyramimonas_sp.AAC.1
MWEGSLWDFNRFPMRLQQGSPWSPTGSPLKPQQAPRLSSAYRVLARLTKGLEMCEAWQG